MAQSAEPRMGGQPVLRMWIKGGSDLVDALLPIGRGGTKLESGVAALVAAAHGPVHRVEIVQEPGEPCGQWLGRLAPPVDGVQDVIDPTDMTTGAGAMWGSSNLLQFRPDVVALSLSADLATPAEEFLASMSRIVRLLHDRIGAHVLILSCSSVDPSDGGDATPDCVSLRAHRLNRALIELSVLEGVSIVDADRLIAQLGARPHVDAFLDYSTEACSAIAHEFLRVMEDYGFFEARPLVAQIGRRREPA